jgi:hypothetical protein
MASTLPVLESCKNVEKLFRSIQAAKRPEAFTHKFLYETLGLKSIADRPLVAFLRTLGFLDAANKPTAEYAALKNEAEAKRAVARAVRRAYAPLFAANEKAHQLPGDQLRGLVAQVAGSDANTTAKIAGALNTLLKLADFSEPEVAPPKGAPEEKGIEETGEEAPAKPGSLRPEFHYNIQVHLPANATEETYLNIFNALRRVFR